MIFPALRAAASSVGKKRHERLTNSSVPSVRFQSLATSNFKGNENHQQLGQGGGLPELSPVRWLGALQPSQGARQEGLSKSSPGARRGTRRDSARGIESAHKYIEEDNRGMEDLEPEQQGRVGKDAGEKNENESPNYWVGMLAAGFQGHSSWSNYLSEIFGWVAKGNLEKPPC